MAKRIKIAPGLYRQETKQGPSFYAKFSYRRKEHTPQLKENGEPIRDQDWAIKFWNSAQLDLQKGIFPFKEEKRIEEWIAEYLKFWKPPRNAPSTHKDKSIRLGHWLRWTKERYPRVVYIGDLNSEHFEAFQTRENVTATSVNADFRYIRHALSFAIEREWLAKSPIARLKRLPEAKKPKKTLPPDIIAKVFKHLNPVARAAWAFCSDTGVRPGEMFVLRWDQISFKERKASYTQGKTGRVKTVWFSEGTKKLIEAIPPKGPTVFYNTKGEPFNRQSWRDTVYRAADAAKVMKWGDGTRSGHKRIIWGTPPNPYALRHTVTTAMLEDSDIATVRDAMGHSSLTVTNIYAHSSEERIKAAFERLQKRKK